MYNKKMVVLGNCGCNGNCYRCGGEDSYGMESQSFILLDLKLEHFFFLHKNKNIKLITIQVK